MNELIGSTINKFAFRIINSVSSSHFVIFMPSLISSYLHLLVVWCNGYSALASINEVNLHQAPLVLRWATVFGFNSWCRSAGHLFRYVSNQSATFHPSWTINEYQLRLGRQRQVWFIPLADERGVCR